MSASAPRGRATEVLARLKEKRAQKSDDVVSPAPAPVSPSVNAPVTVSPAVTPSTQPKTIVSAPVSQTPSLPPSVQPAPSVAAEEGVSHMFSPPTSHYPHPQHEYLSELTAVRAERDRLLQELEYARSVGSTNPVEADHYRNELSALQRQLDSSAAALQAAQREVGELRSHLAATEDERAQLQSEIADALARVTALQLERDRLQQDAASTRGQLATLREQLQQEVDTSQQSSHGERLRLLQELAEARVHVEVAQREADELRAQLAAATHAAQEHRTLSEQEVATARRVAEEATAVALADRERYQRDVAALHEPLAALTAATHAQRETDDEARAEERARLLAELSKQQELAAQRLREAEAAHEAATAQLLLDAEQRESEHAAGLAALRAQQLADRTQLLDEFRARESEMLATHAQSLERITQLEREMAEAEGHKAREIAVAQQETLSRAEQEFHESLQMIKEELNAAAQQRVDLAVAETRAHYEAIVMAKQAEVNQALETRTALEEEEKQRWQELLHGVRHTHVSLLTEYEEKFREKYDAYLSHWESLLTSETQKLQDEAAKTAEKRHQVEVDTRLAMRKVRTAAFIWKIDMEREMGGRMRDEIRRVEEGYAAAMNAQIRKTAQEQAQSNAELAVLHEQFARAQSEILRLTDEARKRIELEQLRQREETEMSKTQTDLLAALQQLWSALETSAQERADFAVGLLLADSPALTAALRQEGQRLYALLPIAQAAARRDFLLERLTSSAKRTSGAQQRMFVLDSEQLQREERERNEIVTELRAVDEHLRRAMLEHEQTYGRYFMWKGQNLLATMDRQTEAAITLTLAPAVVPAPAAVRASASRSVHAPNSPRTPVLRGSPAGASPRLTGASLSSPRMAGRRGTPERGAIALRPLEPSVGAHAGKQHSPVHGLVGAVPSASSAAVASAAAVSTGVVMSAEAVSPAHQLSQQTRSRALRSPSPMQSLHTSMTEAGVDGDAGLAAQRDTLLEHLRLRLRSDYYPEDASPSHEESTLSI